jgi:hypothetical protein
MRRVEIRGSNGRMDLVLRTSRNWAARAPSWIGGARILIETGETKDSNLRSERFCTSPKTLLQACPEQVIGAEEAMLMPVAEACLHIGQWPCAIPGVLHARVIIPVLMPSHCAMQNSADICPATSRSKSSGNVALYITDPQSTPAAESTQTRARPGPLLDSRQIGNSLVDGRLVMKCRLIGKHC